MEFELKEMDFSTIIDRGLKLFKNNFVPLVVIMALFYGPFLLVMNYAQEATTKSIGESETLPQMFEKMAKGEPPDFTNFDFEELFTQMVPSPEMAAITLGLAFLLLLLSPLSYLAIFKVLAEYIQGRTVTVGAAIGYASHRYWILLGAMIITSLLLSIVVCIFTSLSCATIFLSCLTIPIVILAALFGSIFMSVLPCVIILENIGSGGSISRTWNLLKGFWWRSLGIYFLVSLIIGVVTWIFTMIGRGIGAYLPGDMSLFFNAAVSTLFSVIFQPIAWAVVFLIYIDIRIRKENFDLQILADRTLGTKKPSATIELPKDNNDDAWS